MYKYSSSSLLVTVLIYWGTRHLYKRSKLVFLSPLLLCPLALMFIISVSGFSYESYMLGGKWLNYLLAPATVAFAIPLYKHLDLLKKHALEIITSVSLGSLFAVLSSVISTAFLHLTPEIIKSMAPRSITTPIAIDIAQGIGAIPTMTAVFVILTGLSGLIIGPYLLHLLPLHSAVARGVMFGMGAHGCGTAKAMEIGQVEGTISSLAMIIAAGITVAITPLLLHLML